MNDHGLRRPHASSAAGSVDQETIGAYDAGAAGFAKDWHAQPTATDIHEIVRRYFRPGLTADVGCGSGREVAFLAASGFDAVGYDASDALLEHARSRYPKLRFHTGMLPSLEGVPEAAFENVLCETVIMHLRRPQILAAVRRLTALLKPGGTLYLSWRVTKGADQRDRLGRLYSVFESALVREALDGIAAILLDDEPVSASSGKRIHRIVARRNPL
jgi:SAM-dependent methyltransferase